MKHNLTYEGVPVTYNFFPGDDAFIFYGEFKLINHSNEDAEVLFDKAELLTDNSQQEIPTFYVHLEGNLVEKKVKVSGNSINRIKITFPFIAVQELRFSNIKIRSQITSLPETFIANSELIIFYETGKK